MSAAHVKVAYLSYRTIDSSVGQYVGSLIPSTEWRAIQKKLNRFVCLCRIKDQKNIFLNIEYFDFSSEIEKLLKFLSLGKSGSKEHSRKYRGF